MSKYLEKLNNKLKLLKLLHKPMTRKDVEDHFENTNNNLSERTLREYTYEGDIEIGDVIIPFQIMQVKDSWKIYSNAYAENGGYGDGRLGSRASVHPVILPLNLTEIYMLTNGILDYLGPTHPQYRAYKNIANKIYPQLSDYAKSRIPNNLHGLKTSGLVEYTSESEMVERFSTALKANHVIITDSNDKKHYGKLDWRRRELYLVEGNKETPINELCIKNIEPEW